MLATVDLGLVTIYKNIREFTGTVTLAGGASTTKTFTAPDATGFFESYVSIDNRISTDIEVTGNEIVVMFMNTSSSQISASFNIRIGFSGV